MFYKLLDNKSNLITFSNEASFYKYSKTSNTLISVKEDIADIVIINDRVYNLQGKSSPEDAIYSIISISEEEYNELQASIGNKPDVIPLYLKRIREEKIAELCSICEQKIIEGCDVNLSKGIEHFKFTDHDQLNINRLMNCIQMAKLNKIIYHSTGNKATYYSAADFNRIYNAMIKHITYHTTYFNLLKNHINNMYSPKEIKEIIYGSSLKESSDIELLKDIRRLY